MANIKSQIKRNITNLKAQKINKACKSKLKTLTRKIKEYCKQNDLINAKKTLSEAFKSYDKAVKKRIITKNFAANKKAKLHILVNCINKK